MGARHTKPIQATVANGSVLFTHADFYRCSPLQRVPSAPDRLCSEDNGHTLHPSLLEVEYAEELVPHSFRFQYLHEDDGRTAIEVEDDTVGTTEWNFKSLVREELAPPSVSTQYLSGDVETTDVDEDEDTAGTTEWNFRSLGPVVEPDIETGAEDTTESDQITRPEVDETESVQTGRAPLLTDVRDFLCRSCKLVYDWRLEYREPVFGRMTFTVGAKESAIMGRYLLPRPAHSSPLGTFVETAQLLRSGYIALQDTETQKHEGDRSCVHHEEVIRYTMNDLTSMLHLDVIFPLLYQTGICTWNDIAVIQECGLTNVIRQRMRLMGHLSRSGMDKWHSFLNILQGTGQDELLQRVRHTQQLLDQVD